MQSLQQTRDEMARALQEGIIPFWLKRGIDRECGGYTTGFDAEGSPAGNTDKYLVTQARMLWGFAYLSDHCVPAQREALLVAAQHGADFILKHFWDNTHGGFAWKTDRQGNVLDNGKVVYGQSFALYALAEHARHQGGEAALDYARRTMALLQLYAADTLNGGYYENLEADWSVSAGGKYAGDRKSLDIHMHLMEAFTALYAASGREIDARKLREVIGLLLRHMINTEKGYGYNQFNLAFSRLPAIDIYRTWNDERTVGECIEEPTDSTSYGHNVELSWLLDQALALLGDDEDPAITGVIRRLLDHSLAHGYDYEYGGVYRDGVADQQVLVTDKEWWQNFEALVGYSNGYLRFGDEKYLSALQNTWAFARDKFLHPTLGESRQLLDRAGAPIVADLGNPWKGIYHTGRALAETIIRIDHAIQKEA